MTHRASPASIPRPAPDIRTGRPFDIRHLVVDSSDAHPSGANGVHRVAHELAGEQVAAGHDARVVMLRRSTLRSRIDPDDSPVDVVAMVGPTVAGRVVRLSPSVVRALLAGTDGRTLFHIHSVREPLLIQVCRELRRRSIPYVVTPHGGYSHLCDADHRLTRRLPGLYVRFVESRILDQAKFVHAVSAYEMAIIRRLAPRARIELVRNAAFSSRTGPPLGTPAPRDLLEPFPCFGYLGRYAVAHKGLDLLVEAFRLYRDRGGRGRLELFGTGPSRERVRALVAASQADDVVTVGGERFGDGKRAAFAAWHFFVQPSRFEGAPIGAVEAALSGLPLIVTAATGIADEVGRFEAGFPIGRPTVRAIAEALLAADAVTPVEWNRMSRQAHRMARSFGDWTDVSAALTELYET